MKTGKNASCAALAAPHCLELAQSLKQALARASAGGDTEAVHDVRVICRRLEAAARICRKKAPQLLKRKMSALGVLIRVLQKSFGSARDAEVLLERLNTAVVQSNDAEFEKAREKLRNKIERGQKSALKAASNKWLAGIPSSVCEIFGTACAQASHELNRAEVRHKLGERAAKDLRKQLARVKDAAIAADSPSEKLHWLRVKLKKMRYSLEFYQAGHGIKVQTALSASKNLQEILGTLHDADVSVEWTEKEVADCGIIVDTPGCPYAAMLALAHKDQKECREQFGALWNDAYFNVIEAAASAFLHE